MNHSLGSASTHTHTGRAGKVQLLHIYRLVFCIPFCIISVWDAYIHELRYRVSFLQACHHVIDVTVPENSKVERATCRRGRNYGPLRELKLIKQADFLLVDSCHIWAPLLLRQASPEPHLTFKQNQIPTFDRERLGLGVVTQNENKIVTLCLPDGQYH